MRKEPDYYSILGVDPSATAEELRARRNRLVRELHPDRHAGDPVYLERLTEINVAFHELRDEFRRRAYDRRRREATVRPQVSAQNHHMTYYGNTATVRAARPSVRTEFQTARRPQAPQKAVHKRQALIGAIFAAVAAAVVILGFLVFGNIQLQSPDTAIHPQSLPNLLGANQPSQVQLSQQDLSIEENYQHRLSDVINDAQQTVEAASTTASILEDEGSMEKAARLRRETTELEMKLLSAGDAVRQLGSTRTGSEETQLEAQMDARLDRLDSFDRSLNKEQLSYRGNGLAATASGTKVGDSVPSTPSGDGPQNSLSIP